ncbi:hypothetical protein SELMODRAFT_405957 [Selaginella moellendorffii]|uniref:ABC transmembrane type-1 domain-containing protein n=1 Tax=Selaginella moellendorffii TaxID=88036 RepID=D8R074_SELML|nr:hypothetical protein SELMODRAFT_405957 [Selaginella moellendorffii]
MGQFWETKIENGIAAFTPCVTDTLVINIAALLRRQGDPADQVLLGRPRCEAQRSSYRSSCLAQLALRISSDNPEGNKSLPPYEAFIILFLFDMTVPMVIEGMRSGFLAVTSQHKCYAWEDSFSSKIQNDKLSWFRKAQLLSAAVNAKVSLTRSQELLLADELALLPNPPMQKDLPAISVSGIQRSVIMYYLELLTIQCATTGLSKRIGTGPPNISSRQDQDLTETGERGTKMLSVDSGLWPSYFFATLWQKLFDFLAPLGSVIEHSQLRVKNTVPTFTMVSMEHCHFVRYLASCSDYALKLVFTTGCWRPSFVLMSFFHTNPISRIVNRSLKTPERSTGTWHCCLSAFVLIGVDNTISLWGILRLLVGFYAAYLCFLSTMREDSITRSPVYAQFEEALNGVATIRACRAHDRLAELNGKTMDNNVRFTLVNMSGNRWLGIRLEFIGGLMIFLAAAFAVLANANASSQASVAPQMGLLLSYFNAVERVGTYAELPPEAPLVVENRRPPPGWPSAGAKVVMRYRPDLPPVLHGLCSIRFNLDPFNEHKDVKIWESLERDHLKDVVKRNSKRLDAEEPEKTLASDRDNSLV